MPNSGCGGAAAAAAADRQLVTEELRSAGVGTGRRLAITGPSSPAVRVFTNASQTGLYTDTSGFYDPYGSFHRCSAHGLPAAVTSRRERLRSGVAKWRERHRARG